MSRSGHWQALLAGDILGLGAGKWALGGDRLRKGDSDLVQHMLLPPDEEHRLAEAGGRGGGCLLVYHNQHLAGILYRVD